MKKRSQIARTNDDEPVWKLHNRQEKGDETCVEVFINGIFKLHAVIIVITTCFMVFDVPHKFESFKM